MKKFELTAEVKEFFGIKLFRIKALVAFGNVRAGELGGWVEKESNLAQDGNAWVFDDARVSGNAWVYGDARVSGDARVYGNVLVSGNARVYDDALLYGDAWVSGNAWVYGDARVSGNALVYDDARVYCDADWSTISPIGSENGVLTAFRKKDGSVIVRRGCFSGTIEEFESAVNKRHCDNKHGEIYRHVISLLKLRFNLS